MGQGTNREVPNSRVNVTVLPRFRIALAVLISAVSFLTGCSKVEKPLAEAPPPPLTAQADQPQQMSKLPPPLMSEVQEAVKRVFKETVLIDTSHKPTFIVGDFNGDLSQDIAIVLMPASGKLAELNEEFPNWILRDLAGPNQPASPRLRVTENEVLLAVIHGYGPNGWRDQQATQTYLLKNAAGSGMEAHSAKDFVAAHQAKKVPQLHGDVVAEERGGNPGYLYYAGATYAWYDPKTFKGEPERGMVHVPPSEKLKKID
jgi:hypothetical protein